MKGCLGDKCKWNLCHQTSKDGWGTKDFHTHSDHKGFTVPLVEVGYYIFGGYADQNWGGK